MLSLSQLDDVPNDKHYCGHKLQGCAENIAGRREDSSQILKHIVRNIFARLGVDVEQVN